MLITCVCLIIYVSLCGFLLWHLNLIRMGCTTNELSKWKRVKRNSTTSITPPFIYDVGVLQNFLNVLSPVDNIVKIQAPQAETTTCALPANDEPQVHRRTGRSKTNSV